MRLWHDDVRPPPKGWTWARTNDDAKNLLALHDVVEVSLDHDLGYDGPPPGPCAKCHATGHVYPYVELPNSGDTDGTPVKTPCPDCDGDGFIGGDVLYIAGTSEDDGLKLVMWMVANDKVPPRVTIHSWNPDGARRMAEALRDAGHSPTVRPYKAPAC